MIIETNKKPADNDILIYKNGEWTLIDKDSIIASLEKETKELKEQVATLNSELNTAKETINAKLKEYYSILQLLAKEYKENA